MMKRILALIIVFCLAASLFCACGKEINNDNNTDTPTVSGDQPVSPSPEGGEPAQPGNTDTPAAPVGETWNGQDITFVKENGIQYIWDQLDDDVKMNLAQIMNAMRNAELFVELEYGIPKDDNQRKMFLQFVYNCAMDYPYVSTQFNVQSSDDSTDTVKVVIIPYNFEVIQTEDDCKALTAELNAELDKIVAGMPAGTEWEQIKYLHDYLVFNTTYGEDCKLPFTAYGAIVEHMATCQGYADAMHLLLSRAGFETCYAIGHGESLDATHKWNYVHLSDGNWYVVDPTWADPKGQDDPNYICYDYFMISDEVLLQDHAQKFDNDYYKNTYGVDYYHKVPEATSMDLSWHRLMGYECSTVEEAYAAAEKQVLECAQEGRRYVYIRMTDEESYNAANDKIFKASGEAKLMDIIASVNEQVGETFAESRWGRYGGHDEGKGPYTIIITLRDPE